MGRFRVLPGSEDGVVLLDRRSYEPTVVSREGNGPVGDLRPGYLIEATLDRSEARPTVESLSVRRPTLYAFADRADPVFEVAQNAWQEAQAAGESMNGRVTRNTDNVVNGVVYVFADGDVGSRFAEFRDGTRPLEPLLDRVNDRDEEPAPRELFVLRPTQAEFVIVTIALAKGGRFAETLRETYDCPREPEPLA